MIKRALEELNNLEQEIEPTDLDYEEPDVMKVTRADDLQETIGRYYLQREMIRDHARAAMYEKLRQMLPPGIVEGISDKELNKLYDTLEQCSIARLSIGRAVSEEMHKRRGVE